MERGNILKNIAATAFCLGMGIIVSSCTITTDNGSFARTLEAANADYTRYPSVHSINPHLGLDEAYRIQAEMVRRRARRDTIAGFKGGVTTRATQIAMKTEEPILGVLFQSGSKASTAQIVLHPNREIGIEAEVGFVTGAPITKPLPDVAALQRYVASIVPVIEFPELGYEKPATVDAMDLIAANIGSERYVRGQPVSAGSIDPDKVAARLYRDGQLIGEAQGSNIEPSQWQAVLWMVNRTLKLYGPIREGSLFITGSMLRPPLGRPGSYRIDYGELGSISFEMVSE